MKHFLKLTIFNIFLGLTSLSFAAPSIELLNQKLASFHSLSANFVQKVTSDDGSVLQTSTGNMVIMRPGKFRWTVNTPITQQLITNGKTLWIYEPDLEQLTVRQLGNNLGQTPLILLTNPRAQIQNSFQVKQSGSKFILTPKSKKDHFKQVVITFAGNQPQSLQLLNELGQNTLIQLGNVKMNPPVDMNQFNFVPPKGIDVIDMTKPTTHHKRTS